MNSEITIFDKILRREIPAAIVYEDEHILAFNDVNPQAPIHVLVIPKHKAESFAALGQWSATAVGQLFLGAAKVAAVLGLESDGYRVVTNVGKNGQQSVAYLHLHILGGRQLAWPPG